MSFVKFLQFNWFAKFYRGISVNSFTYFKLVFYVPVVNFSVAKVGLAKTASTGVGALMVAVVIMLLAHATVLQDGRYLKPEKTANILLPRYWFPCKMAF